MSKPLLLTGATGFLGRHVLAAIARRDPKRPVYALMRRTADWSALDYAADFPNVTPLEGDLTGSEAWMDDPRLADLGGILHLAAIVQHSRRDTEPARRANVDGTLRLIRLAGRDRVPMVFVSTSGTVACHRRPGKTVDEDAPFADGVVGTWPYYASKIEAEREGRALASRLGVPLTVVRPPVMLGPGDHRFRSTSLIIRLMRGKIPVAIAGGISFCDVRDAAEAMVAALDHPARRAVYHVPGHDMAVGEFFARVGAAAGVKAPSRFAPYKVIHFLATQAERVAHATGGHSVLPDPVVVEMGRHYWGISSRHIESELGYRLRPADETLADTIAWLKDHHPQLK